MVLENSNNEATISLKLLIIRQCFNKLFYGACAILYIFCIDTLVNFEANNKIEKNYKTDMQHNFVIASISC